MTKRSTAKARDRDRPRDARDGDRDVLGQFRPYVAQWFRRTFPAPSPAQELAWPAIGRGENTLLLAPTGSGKTLAAFLCAIDALCRRSERDELADGIDVLYITPLKALGNDIQRNLLQPLEGIRELAGSRVGEIRVAVRSGDTPQSARSRMVTKPPHILITTPESLYILLSSGRIAPALARIGTVIVDEVHSLCDNKRGVHLSLSLERLQERVGRPLQRVGCSATLRPLEDIAAFLVGRGDDGAPRPCTILNAGMRKDLDVRVMAPLADFLEASNTALWSSAYELLLDEVRRHRTTLVFTNSRYKAERTSLRLKEAAGDDARIGAHHGSMSKETRLETEEALKAGGLDAVVATASLELGIDIGSVDLVYQLESPKSVATGLQRVGRAGHLLDATSKGRLLIFERDELMEAAAVCRAMVAGEVDAVHIPRGCLDVLSQQIVGAAAARDWRADELFGIVRRAYPYHDLPREHFDAVLAMVAGELGFDMADGPRPLVLWDRAGGKVSASRSAARVSVMCAGTIPERSEYDVVIASSKKRVGTVQDEFVDDSVRVGDVFVLGSTPWKMVGIQRNRLFVEEAPGATPTVPWWHGPVASRTSEVGVRVGVLRRAIAGRLGDPEAIDWLQEEYRLDPNAAIALADYVREQQLAAGMVPDEQRLLVETWRDELGQTNVIVHSPYGMRINRTWAVAMAQAAKVKLGQDWAVHASNDVIVLRLDERQTPALHPPDAQALLGSLGADGVRDIVEASAVQSAAFGVSFRDAAACAFQIQRTWNGRRVPLWVQNLRAEDLQQAARKNPDYPVTREVVRQYLCEGLDVAGLEDLLVLVHTGDAELVFRDVDAPSPFAHSALVLQRYEVGSEMGRDRRAHLLRLHRQVLQEVLTEEQMAELLDVRAIERLEKRLLHQSDASRAQRSDELADAIRDLGDVPATVDAVGRIVVGNPVPMLRRLVAQRRVLAIRLPGRDQDPVRLVATDVWREYYDAFAQGQGRGRPQLLVPQFRGRELAGFERGAATKLIPAKWRRVAPQAQARRSVVERFLRRRGPVTQYEVMNHTGWPIGAVEVILDDLVQTGTVARGVYRSDKPSPQWVNKANLEEIHRLTMGYLRRELAACAPYEMVDFVTRWQHLHPDTRLKGMDGLRTAIHQLQGAETVQGVLEGDVLPGRVTDYRPEMLDRLIASGEVQWRRVSTQAIRRGVVSLCFRGDSEWLGRGDALKFDTLEAADCDIPDAIHAVRGYFQQHGTGFFDDVLDAIDHEEGAVLRGLWHLAWCGEVTCETFECIRHANFQATLSACYDLANTPRKILRGRDSMARVLERMGRRRLDPRLGRWVATERLVPAHQPVPESDVAKRWTHQLLERWGIVSKDVLSAEVAAPPWSVLVRELKRLELLGKVQRGYFVAGHFGAQYGLPEAIELLRDCRARRSDGQELGCLPDEPVFAMSLHDPANLYASCLDMVDDAGQVMKRSRKLATASARMVVQAGQVLLLAHGQQLAALNRRQLHKCIGQLTHTRSGAAAPTSFKLWNGYPIDVSPVASVLWDLGFRFDRKGGMCWPATTSVGTRPAESKQDLFLPYHSEPAPVEFGPAWLVGRTPGPLQEAMRAALDLVVRHLDRDGWTVEWNHEGLWARYAKQARLIVQPRRQYVLLDFALWGVYRRLFRLRCADDAAGEFPEQLLSTILDAEAHSDRVNAKRRK